MFDGERRVPAPEVRTRRGPLLALLGLWAGVVAVGFALLLAHAGRPGAQGAAPPDWPSASPLSPAVEGNTLLFFAHPRCPCTRASVAELERLLASLPVRPAVLALLYRPSSAEEGWERTDLFDRLAAIPGARTVVDVDAAEARRFGVRTSGHVLVYGPGRALRFSGGITAARGHEGDSAARDAARATLVGAGTTEVARAPVYGCRIVSAAQVGAEP
jgi:hypothetical protein